MRRGQRVLVVNLAVGAAVVVVRRSVPTSQSGLHVNGLGLGRNRDLIFIFGRGFGSRSRGRNRRRRDSRWRRNVFRGRILMSAAGRQQQQGGGDSGEERKPRGYSFFCCFADSM